MAPPPSVSVCAGSLEVPHAGLQQDPLDPGFRGGASGKAGDGHATGLVETIFDRGELSYVRRERNGGPSCVDRQKVRSGCTKPVNSVVPRVFSFHFSSDFFQQPNQPSVRFSSVHSPRASSIDQRRIGRAWRGSGVLLEALESVPDQLQAQAQLHVTLLSRT